MRAARGAARGKGQANDFYQGHPARRGVLNDLIRQAVANKERVVGSLDRCDAILEEARRRWTAHDAPRAAMPRTLGVDGSCNSISYQGVELWAATAVAATPDGRSEVTVEPRMEVGRNPSLHDTMRRMEAEACARASEIAEVVLVDGSLRTVFIADDEAARNEVLRLIRGNETRIIFVSKTSEVDFEFGDMGSVAGDMWYYGKAGREAGFSRPLSKRAPRSSAQITSTYARVVRDAPLIKVEMLGGGIGEADVRGLLARLAAQCVGGYPQALRQAHNLCTITGEDMARVVPFLGIISPVGARAVLQ